jgi:hypothetical protein
VIERCRFEEPILTDFIDRAGATHLVACHRAGETSLR